MKIKAEKQKNLLPENHYIQNLNPKKHPKHIYKNILHDIRIYKKDIRKGKPFT